MKIWIVWASGAVGVEMIQCLKDLEVEFEELRLGASDKSEGKIVKTPFWEQTLRKIQDDFFEKIDYCLFSAGWDISKKYVPYASEQGVVCIDNSSAFRYDETVPLVIPQINFDTIGDAKIIANPNCTTAIAAMVLYPIYKKYGIKKIIMSTYQATSGAWAKWMQELLDNTQAYFSWEAPKVEHFAHDITFNLIPHIDAFQENGYTKEEMKVVWETHKIFGDDSIEISCTCVRVPVLRAHSESIVIETEKEVDLEDIKAILAQSPWVKLVDNPSQKLYPMPKNASGNYDVEVGRIRKNLVFWDRGIELFVSGDQLLRGAALNAVEILKRLIAEKE